MGLNRDHVLFLVTFETDLPAALVQQAWLVRLMRIVTGAAFAISDRVMFVSGRGDLLLELVVAFVAEVANRFGEQVLQLRFMGLMTRTALSILHGLMFDLGHLQLLFKHVMAVEAEFPIWLRQQALLAGGM